MSTVAKRRRMADRAGVTYEEWAMMHPEIPRRERRATPHAFADALIALAKGAA